MGKFKFGTAKHQTLPFTIGGVTFFSKPLTIGEELPLAALGDDYDAGEATPEQQRALMAGQAEYMATLLRSRLVATEGEAPNIDTDWAMQHFGVSNLISVLAFLRSGKRPSEPLELVNWSDEPLEIDDLRFAMRQFNFAEQLEAANLANVEGGAAASVGASLDVLALLLNNRIQGDEPRPVVTAQWLEQHLTAADIQGVMTLLQNGPDALADEGDENPNAPENLQLVADGSTDSST